MKNILKSLATTLLIVLTSCARMGQPDGGWYDETPPRVVSSFPADGSTGVSTRKVVINFDEYIKLENPNEKVIISPPQLEQAEIKTQGKRIVVELKDPLQPNTTYTIDFSDAISDNNEGNPMGNYTYSFSTGETIDSMEVGGYVVDASNLDPVKGILVGLYDSQNGDELFKTAPMKRVSRTDADGKFSIKGVAPGSYKAYALLDTDGDFHLTQRGEKIAFNSDIITPSHKPDVRQDTIWADSLHIKEIKQASYTHFLPDNIVLRAFTEQPSDRYLMRTERRDAERITMAFSCGHDDLPRITPLNFVLTDQNHVVETSFSRDTVAYWLRDSALINQDTLRLAAQYWATDTIGNLTLTTDTLELMPRYGAAKRERDRQKQLEQWQKKQERAARTGREVEYVRPGEALEPRYLLRSEIDPDGYLAINFTTPIAHIDTTRLHLYARHDSLWYSVGMKQIANPAPANQLTIDQQRTICLQAAWIPGTEYSFEVDSAAFTDIFNRVSQKYKKGFRVRNDDEYGSLFVNIQSPYEGNIVVELLSDADKPLRHTTAVDGTAEFYYLLPGTYYMRAFIDTNANNQWDSGCFDELRQPETVVYYPQPIVVRERWDITQSWHPDATPAYKQKPSDLKREHSTAKKSAHYLNIEREKKLGKTQNKSKDREN